MRKIVLVAIEVVLWAVCIGFALFFYQGHLQYPEDWIPVFGIIVMLGMGVLFTIFMLAAWRIFEQNQREFDEKRDQRELELSHSIFDPSVPLSLQGDTLKINRGLRIEVVPLRDIYWIHHHSARSRHSMHANYNLHLYLKSGKHILALFDGGNMVGVRRILEKISEIQPGILMSEGYHSEKYNEYKKAYKSR